jgi:type IX secretion system PorP/SprF family membrane protein
MKKIFLIIIVVIGINEAFAQQMPQYTQYMLNEFVCNPAFTGIDDYYYARSNNRYQWMGGGNGGITDAPRTYSLSMYGPHKSKSMGFGGFLVSDFVGPTTHTGIYGSYAYNFKIVNNLRLSFGLHAGILQFRIDGTKVILQKPDDPLALKNFMTYVPDATFGMLLFSKKFTFGFSASQLIGSKLDVYSEKTKAIARLNNHFFVTSSYKIDVSDDVRIEPSIMFKAMMPTPAQIELNLKSTFIKTFWVGVSGRGSKYALESIAFMMGYNLNEQFIMGYSYDMLISDINIAAKASHEVMLGMRFNKQRKTPAF